jgi:hypothetical protein
MQPGLAAGEMPATALLAAVAGQTLAELLAVPERRSAGRGLGRKPALARADLAPTRLAGLLVGEPALDVPLTHDRAHALRTASPTGLPSAFRRPPSERPEYSPQHRTRPAGPIPEAPSGMRIIGKELGEPQRQAHHHTIARRHSTPIDPPERRAHSAAHDRIRGLGRAELASASATEGRSDPAALPQVRRPVSLTLALKRGARVTHETLSRRSKPSCDRLRIPVRDGAGPKYAGFLMTGIASVRGRAPTRSRTARFGSTLVSVFRASSEEE